MLPDRQHREPGQDGECHLFLVGAREGFPDDGSHDPVKVDSILEGEILVGDLGERVRGQGSGGAVVNKTIAPKAHADDAGSDASTVINLDDSVSMVGPKGLGAPQARFTKRRPKTTSSAR